MTDHSWPVTSLRYLDIMLWLWFITSLFIKAINAWHFSNNNIDYFTLVVTNVITCITFYNFHTRADMAEWTVLQFLLQREQVWREQTLHFHPLQLRTCNATFLLILLITNWHSVFKGKKWILNLERSFKIIF